jgi:chromosome partitioning protein
MTQVVAVYSMKGGVGKTTIAVNLAYCSAALGGRRTLLWEIDAQGAASFLLGREKRSTKARRVFSREVEPADLIEPTDWPGLDLLGADLSLRHIDRTLSEAEKPKRLRKLLQGLSGEYDRIFLDCPPGLGELSDQVFRAADLIVVPVPPTPLALRSLDQVREHIDQDHAGKPPLMPVFSMVDRRKKLHRELAGEHTDWPVIPQASAIERMSIDRKPLAASASNSNAARVMTGLWHQVERQLENPAPKSGRNSKLARIPGTAATAPRAR